MKRWIAAAMITTASPAVAWEFTETTICAVSHKTADVAIALTFDPTSGVYDIALTLESASWGDGTAFRILFEGKNSIVIGTDQQSVSDNGATLNVSDSGFGNVLDGIQFNDQMTASLGDQVVTIPLDGAAGPMAAFRQCPSIATS